MASITGFHHTAIRSPQFDASLRFYIDVLGMKEKISWGEAPNRAVMIDAGDGNYVEIFERSEAAPTVEATILHFALRTDDCAAMLEKAREAGAEVTMETNDLTIDSSIGPVPVRIAFFKGPDGEVIELLGEGTGSAIFYSSHDADRRPAYVHLHITAGPERFPGLCAVKTSEHEWRRKMAVHSEGFSTLRA